MFHNDTCQGWIWPWPSSWKPLTIQQGLCAGCLVWWEGRRRSSSWTFLLRLVSCQGSGPAHFPSHIPTACYTGIYSSSPSLLWPFSGMIWLESFWTEVLGNRREGSFIAGGPTEPGRPENIACLQYLQAALQLWISFFCPDDLPSWRLRWRKQWINPAELCSVMPTLGTSFRRSIIASLTFTRIQYKRFFPHPGI